MVSTTRDKFLPRKSFAFKSRKKVLVTEDRKAEETKGRNEDKCVEEKILCPKVTSAIEVKNRNSQKINMEVRYLHENMYTSHVNFETLY